MQGQWKNWGVHLMGLAQGGLYYGPKNETFRSDMRRICEIAQELQDRAEEWDPEQQKVWGVEIHRISDFSLVRELINDQYDLILFRLKFDHVTIDDVINYVREIAEEMEEEVPLRAWNEWKLRSERNK